MNSSLSQNILRLKCVIIRKMSEILEKQPKTMMLKIAMTSLICNKGTKTRMAAAKTTAVAIDGEKYQ